MAITQGRTKKGLPRCYICGQPYKRLSIENCTEKALCDKHYRQIAEREEHHACPRNYE